ncbi:MAG: PmoA family protein [Pirellulales bacterium]|nr:PmoA family protein [Pirellulales bacterium]
MLTRISFVCLFAFALSAQTVRAEDAQPAHVTAAQSPDGSKVVIQIDGQPFAEYLTRSGNKPIVWPIIGPTGKPMTRQWPMAESEPGERKDHCHHRSLWFTHGDVNGYDFWLEPKPGKKNERAGSIEHRKFLKIESGKSAVVKTSNDWLDPTGKKILQDERTLRFGGDADSRWIDFDITLEAADRPVTFGDTKEGSMGIRVAASIKPDAKLGGRLVNSEGQVDGKAWGKRAAWVDYTGPLGDETVGICLMNHPSSFRYPTHWHARTYGLCSANPFGWSDFERDESVDGSYTIPAGQSITLRYRIFFHKGAARPAMLQDAFKEYVKQGE